MTNYKDFQGKALLFKTCILIGTQLCKNLLVLTLFLTGNTQIIIKSGMIY